MKNMKSTKRALLVSVLSLFVCFTMLIGTTYAWFTDSVTSAGNIIKTGTLDVMLEYKTPTDTGWNDASEGPIFEYDNWEPGYVMVRNVKISNVGSLDLKYVLTIVPNQEVEDGKVDLADVIEAYMFPAGTTIDRDALVADKTTQPAYAGTVAELIADVDGAAYGTLADHTSVEYIVVLKMSETAGNEYQNLSLGGGFSVNLLATQLADGAETDDLGAGYDSEATLPVAVGSGSTPVLRDENGTIISTYEDENGISVAGVEVVAPSADKNLADASAKNAGSATIPAGAIDDSAENVSLTIAQVAADGNITVEVGEEAKTYEINVEGLKANNNVPVRVRVYVGKGLNVTKLYHKDVAMADADWQYDPSSGNLYITTTSFSPFTVIIDGEAVANPEIVIPDGATLPEGMPTPTVEEYDLMLTPGYSEEEDAPKWGSYGAWSPTEGLDSKLETAFVFTSPDIGGAGENPFADWYCDFYVMLDRDLEDKQIFLGGNYGSFGWVGFHNDGFTLEANTEIPLLGSVVVNNWTYEMIAESVGTFICGVGDVDNVLEGATFTVMLRLTNPEDATEYYNVATVKYVFGGDAIVEVE